MSTDPGNERIRRVNREDQPTERGTANWVLMVLVAALLIGFVWLSWMYFSNSWYDDSRQAPVAERH